MRLKASVALSQGGAGAVGAMPGWRAAGRGRGPPPVSRSPPARPSGDSRRFSWAFAFNITNSITTPWGPRSVRAHALSGTMETTLRHVMVTLALPIASLLMKITNFTSFSYLAVSFVLTNTQHKLKTSN